MKFLNINATINVKPQFSGEVLKAGTPLDISGNEANSDAAVGIVASDTAVGAESIAIVTEGTIDLTELTASYGSALTDECIAALKGITFLYGGKAVVPGGDDKFVVEFTMNETLTGGTMNKTVGEIYEAYTAGKTIVGRVTALGWTVEMSLNNVGFDTPAYPSFNFIFVADVPSYILGYTITGVTDDGDSNTFTTVLFALTPASGS